MPWVGAFMRYSATLVRSKSNEIDGRLPGIRDSAALLGIFAAIWASTHGLILPLDFLIRK